MLRPSILNVKIWVFYSNRISILLLTWQRLVVHPGVATTPVNDEPKLHEICCWLNGIKVPRNLRKKFKILKYLKLKQIECPNFTQKQKNCKWCHLTDGVEHFNLLLIYYLSKILKHCFSCQKWEMKMVCIFSLILLLLSRF